MTDERELVVIGEVSSSLQRLEDCPKQGCEGAPGVRINIRHEFIDGLLGIEPGCRIVILTWLHKAKRDVLTVHPRNDKTRPLAGVFRTRSPSRPNPVGIHEVTVSGVGESWIDVEPLEALDGTPVIDIKISI